MSNRILSAEDLTAAQPVSIGALGQAAAGGAFRARFADGQQVLRTPQQGLHGASGAPADPLEQARADAFAEGFDAGMRVAAESAASDEGARARLSQTLQQLVPAANGVLSSLVSAAVLRIVTQIVGETAVDRDVLARRVEAVCAFIEEGQSSNSLHLNPDDIALLDGHEFGFPLTANEGIARGSVRLATADGWIEDGPDVQLARLKAVLDDMEGRA